jgi:cyclophilin family peptidyl-prolyl cis-trans isomerase
VLLRSALSFGLVLALFAFARPAASADPKSPANEGDKPVVVVLDTSQGQIEIELDAQKAPISTENFLAYVDSGHYDGTVFHRVIPKFMIQGGGFDESMKQKATRAPIKNEADNGLVNARGTVAMARTSDVNSATAQFFINVVDNGFLNHGGRDFGYAVFAKVTSGMDVADKIAAVKTGGQDVPVEPVVIKKVSRK